jgi:phosphopantothenoylcysteine decarboxylase/phosphopantothenate--cysteine ligase
MVVTNRPDVMGSDRGTFVIMTPGKSRDISGTKEEVAGTIWAVLSDRISGK